jgi:sugar-specific transcriptional regulator TrmB
MNILKQLQEIGLDDKKAQVYLGILRLQEATPQQIAQEADVERTTVYKILEELSRMGLITKTVHGKRMVYCADPVMSLKSFLAKKQSIVDHILPILSALQGAKTPRPKVRYYDSLDGIREVLMESIYCQEKLRRDYAFVDNVVEFLGLRFIQNQIKERVKRGVFVRSLRRQASGSEKDWFLKKENRNVLREARYLQGSAQIEPLIMIYDNTVAVISSKKESFALVIESEEFSAALKTLYDIAWESTKK